MKINDLKLSDEDAALKREVQQPAIAQSNHTDSDSSNNQKFDLNSQPQKVEQEHVEEEKQPVDKVEINEESKQEPEQAAEPIKEESTVDNSLSEPLPASSPSQEAKTEESSKPTVEEEKVQEEKVPKDENNESMVDVPLDDIKHQQTSESVPVSSEVFRFLTPDWEKEWKNSLNLSNLKQAIQYTDDKARAFLAKNPSPDNNIDADKFVEFLKKSSLKGLLPNQVKILVTTYNGNNSIDTWAISYIWGQIFMRQQDIPLFNIDSIKMFKVNYVSQQ